MFSKKNSAEYLGCRKFAPYISEYVLRRGLGFIQKRIIGLQFPDVDGDISSISQFFHRHVWLLKIPSRLTSVENWLPYHQKFLNGRFCCESDQKLTFYSQIINKSTYKHLKPILKIWYMIIWLYGHIGLCLTSSIL